MNKILGNAFERASGLTGYVLKVDNVIVTACHRASHFHSRSAIQSQRQDQRLGEGVSYRRSRFQAAGATRSAATS